VPAVLRTVDVFCLASRGEAVSLALMEAMAHGLACVATDVGDTRDGYEPALYSCRRSNRAPWPTHSTCSSPIQRSAAPSAAGLEPTPGATYRRANGGRDRSGPGCSRVAVAPATPRPRATRRPPSRRSRRGSRSGIRGTNTGTGDPGTDDPVPSSAMSRPDRATRREKPLRFAHQPQHRGALPPCRC
jgi:hypothetical protein